MRRDAPRGALARAADWLAAVEPLPTSLRAVLGYYADTGVLDYRALRLQSHVDSEMDAIVGSAFAAIERELADEFDRPAVEFDYDTKLTLPADLTLGYLYRRAMEDAPPGYDPVADEPRGLLGRLRARLGGSRAAGVDAETRRALRERVEGIESITALVVEALIDGDMRDALNDEEYDDFEVTPPVAGDEERRRVAEVAQRTLEASIEERFPAFPEAVREAYDAAVEVSEGHQDRDGRFRALLEAAGEERADAVREEYKFATFDEPPELFEESVRSLPYFKTQYDRVGVIYDGMIDMYRAAGFEINDDFKRSIVLAIVGAQIWLDDVSDYPEDRAEGQLTPVTAEYVLAEDDAEAHDRVVEIAETYLGHAKRYATASGTPMTGIAVEYIHRAGEASHLPR